MATSLVGTVLNIFLDWLFIFPFGWGLDGAAKATCFSFCIAGLMVIYYFVFMPRTVHLYRLRMTMKSLLLTLRNIGYQIKMGFPAMLGEIAVCGAVIAGNFMFMRYLGEDGVAAYSIACYCFPVIFMMADAIVQSAQPIVSFAHGANNIPRLRESGKLMVRWALGAGLTASLLMSFFAPYITMLFLDKTERAFAICAEGLPYFGAGVVFITFNIVVIGYLQSIEQSARATVYTLLRGFIIVIPCFIILPELIGNTGIWLAIPVAEVLTTLVIIFSARIISRT